MFLVNSRLGLVSATLNASNSNSVVTCQVPLIPKLRGYFAEFLHHDSLDRLGILYLSTCVGLGYGRLISRSRSFSRQHRITLTTPRCGHIMSQASRSTDLPILHPTHLTRHSHSREELPSCVPPQLAYYKIRSQTHTTQQPEGCLRSACMFSITRLSTDDISPVTGISTRCPSTTPVGLALGPD